MQRASVLILSLLASPAIAFFFGNSCGCSAPPACPPAPSCGGGGGGKWVQTPVVRYAPGPAPGGYAAGPVGFPQQVGGYAPQGGFAGPVAGGGAYSDAPAGAGSAGYGQQGPAPSPVGGYGPQAPAPAPGAGYGQQVIPSGGYNEAGAGAGEQFKDTPISAAGNKLQEVEEELENAEGNQQRDIAEPAAVSDPIDVKQLKLTNDSECNSEELRNIIIENIDEDLNSAKRLIQLAAEARFGGRFDVVCSTNDFSYVTNTEVYCQHTKEDVSCYSYRQL